MSSPARVRHLRARNDLQELLRTHVRLGRLGFVSGEKALFDDEAHLQALRALLA